MDFTKEKAIELIEQEIEFNKGTGMSQFVMGLQQAKKVLEVEFKREQVSRTGFDEWIENGMK